MSAETLSKGPASASLHQHLSRVAMVHHDPLLKDQHSPAEYVDVLHPDNPTYLSSEGFYLQRATQGSLETKQHAPETLERQQTLEAVRAAIVSVHEIDKGVDTLDWAAATNLLYERATLAADKQSRETLYVSTIIASQFATDPHTRIDLLQKIYEDGREAEVTAICEQSDISIVYAGEGVDPDDDSTYLLSIHGIGKVFETSREQMTKYLDIVTAPSLRNDAVSRPRRALHELSSDIKAGEHTYQDEQPQAERASMNHELVGGLIVDRHKIERLALQEHFLHAQEAAILGSGDLQESLLAKKLAQRFSEGSSVISPNDVAGVPSRPSSDYRVLQNDIQQSILELTQPVIAQYSLEGLPPDSYEELTQAQAANMRFRQITRETAGDLRIARFIDFDQTRQRLNETNLSFFNNEVGRDIWEVAEEGSSLPGAVTAMIQKTIEAGKAFTQSTPPHRPPLAEELRDLLYSERHSLLLGAAKNIESDSPQAGMRITFNRISITRDDAGHLRYEGLLIPPGKTNFDVLAAATLGCPAVRVNRASDKARAEKLTKGNGNYFNNLATVIINEAYRRNMFDPDWYDSATKEFTDPWL